MKLSEQQVSILADKLSDILCRQHLKQPNINAVDGEFEKMLCLAIDINYTTAHHLYQDICKDVNATMNTNVLSDIIAKHINLIGNYIVDNAENDAYHKKQQRYLILTDLEKLQRLASAIACYKGMYKKVYGQKPENTDFYFSFNLAESHLCDILAFMNISLDYKEAFDDIDKDDPEFILKIANKLGTPYSDIVSKDLCNTIAKSRKQYLETDRYLSLLRSRREKNRTTPGSHK